MNWNKIIPIILIFILVVTTYILINRLIEQQKDLVLWQEIQHNNEIALKDSLHVLKKDNQLLYTKLGLVLDLQSKQNTYLQSQSYQLKTLQSITLGLQSLVLTLQGSTTQNGDTITHHFQKDTMFVMIDGKSIIFTKDLNNSYTNLGLSFKPIPIEMSISMNDKNQIMGSVLSKMSGITLTNLNTIVDPSIYGLMKTKEPTFWESLRVGGLLGMTSSDLLNIFNYSLIYGLEVQYKDFGVLYLQSKYGQYGLFKISRSFEDLF